MCAGQHNELVWEGDRLKRDLRQNKEEPEPDLAALAFGTDRKTRKGARTSGVQVPPCSCWWPAPRRSCACEWATSPPGVEVCEWRDGGVVVPSEVEWDDWRADVRRSWNWQTGAVDMGKSREGEKVTEKGNTG